MNYSLNSLEAYQSIVDELPDKRKAVYNVIKDCEEVTSEYIAEFLDWSINRVTGRVQELRKAGLIKIKRTETVRGRTCNVYSIRTPDEPENVFHLTYKEKYEEIVSCLNDLEKTDSIQKFLNTINVRFNFDVK